jgi:hypothetical protein
LCFTLTLTMVAPLFPSPPTPTHPHRELRPRLTETLRAILERGITDIDLSWNGGDKEEVKQMVAAAKRIIPTLDIPDDQPVKASGAGKEKIGLMSLSNIKHSHSGHPHHPHINRHHPTQLNLIQFQSPRYMSYWAYHHNNQAGRTWSWQEKNDMKHGLDAEWEVVFMDKQE